MSDETTLLPCPFCGEYPKIAKDGGSTGPWFCVWHDCPPVEGGKARHYGESLGCISISTAWFHTEAEAIAAWNTRAPVEYYGWFYLPKPKESIVQYGEQRTEKTEHGYKVTQPVEVLESAIRSWGDELGEYIMKRICETWNTRAELGSDDDYEAKMDALLCRLTNGKWSKSRAYSLDFMVSCVDEEYEELYEKERAELGSEINGDTSDGYHTFNELYHHRAVLFSVIVRDHRELAWKARKHHDGTMYDGMFIVGIETPKGQATYHYDLDPYWEMFDCEEREFAPEWDGHTPDEAIARIAELGSGTCEAIRNEHTMTIVCSECGGGGLTIPNKGQKALRNFCPNCGKRIRKAVGR